MIARVLKAVMRSYRPSRCHQLINEFYLFMASRLTTFLLLSFDFPKKLFLVNSFVFGTFKAARKKTLAAGPSMMIVSTFRFTFHKKALQFQPRREEKEEKLLSTLVTFASQKVFDSSERTRKRFVFNTGEHLNIFYGLVIN